MPLSEFELIRRYFEAQAASRDDVTLGIGDDAALVSPPADSELVLAIDTLVAGVHFPEATDPRDIGHKLLAVNLSDLAAMGAAPLWATLALTLPQADEGWLTRFAEGLFALAERFKVALIGGDTTRGPLTLTLQIHGSVPHGTALRRSGARPGDAIFVTGALGGAALGLEALQGRIALADDGLARCRARLDRPEPRLAAGQVLRGLASAAIDISDGLVADLGHITAASGCGARIELERLPLEALEGEGPSLDHRYQAALGGGDDFELCFTLPRERLAELAGCLDGIGCAVTEIGEITESGGVEVVRGDGSPVSLERRGYDHFATGDGR